MSDQGNTHSEMIAKIGCCMPASRQSTKTKAQNYCLFSKTHGDVVGKWEKM